MVLNGRLIKILDSKRVIVDIGFKDGINKDMKFFIYEEGEDIIDPITGEFIDKLEIVKHRLKVSHIQEKFSIMRSDEYIIPTNIEKLLIPQTRIREIRPFILKEKERSNSKRAIKVGDLVREDIA